MSTYSQILCHIIISTKNREHTLTKPFREKFYKFFWGYLESMHCQVFRVGGYSDHFHIVAGIHSSMSMEYLVNEIKKVTSRHIKSLELFPDFKGWQNGFAVFSFGLNEREALINYVKNQETLHAGLTFSDELMGLLSEHKIEFDAKEFF
jgi:REP element-mobilizing transposase RayT